MTPALVFPSLASNRARSTKNSRKRGYGAGHRKLRERLAPFVAGGRARCSRCGEPILPDQAWDLDHSDDRRGYLGPSHRHCNRSTQRSRRRSRKW